MTYKQTKLHNEQIQVFKDIRYLLPKIGSWSNTPEGLEYWLTVQSKLEARATHGTNDGQPWVEPTPDVGPGYRVATIDDTTRRDREYWTAGGYWTRLDYNDSQHLTGATYRVPVDRTPTDDDAKSRPVVMVRDDAEDCWKKRVLVMVLSNDAACRFLITDTERSGYSGWRYCRHLYPGE